MPGKRVRKNPTLEGELKMRIIAILDGADENIKPTLDWIKQQDIILAPYTTQKLSRIMGSLVEIGMVRKGRSKSLNRMVYRLTSKMMEDGYDVDHEEGFGVITRPWNGIDWELEDELINIKNQDS